MAENTPETPDTPQYRYTAEMAGDLEAKWQRIWDETDAFNADNPSGSLAGDLAKHEKYFILDMFPYPSGKGLHVGHPLGYIATDVVARYQRAQGKNVLYTMGYDAFGLPAEQYALQTGQHPAITTHDNIANMSKQLARIGLSHDRRRSFATTDPDYFKWTQWIFLQIFNSWYDPEAPRRDGSGKGAARPITTLVKQYEDGTRPTP
ncbi:class I tRNA ligase family protein, partial [uncultured Mobiluncus sp.]|uniref:class I tRNA ligase family protein n=1 Tax=uncultured Mobiluncus sp. TaxID=293425 RepID=UPI002606D1A5